MRSIFTALSRALQTLFHPKMLALVLWPMLASLLLWSGIAIIFWRSWAADLASWMDKAPFQQWISAGFLAAVSGYVVAFILIILLVPEIYATALLITALFSMKAMVEHVSEKCYPHLERKMGGTFMGSLINSLRVIIVFCLGWVITLPFWFFSPLAVLLPVIFSAYLNQGLFRYDALAEHANRDEFAAIVHRAKVKLYLLGAMVGLLQYVPVLNFFSPVYSGLAFIHLCLEELKTARAG